jgi:hypothetical protein
LGHHVVDAVQIAGQPAIAGQLAQRVHADGAAHLGQRLALLCTSAASSAVKVRALVLAWM